MMNFIPFVSVGIFKLDDDIKNYSEILKNYNHKPIDKYGNEYYHYPKYETRYGSHFIQVNDGKIRAIFCYKDLIYNGINLIGLTIDEFKQITKTNYDTDDIYEIKLFDNEPPFYDYEFEEIGVSARTHYGIICDIIVSSYYDYME